MIRCQNSMEYVCIPQKPNNSIVRHLRHVPVVHVAAVAARGAARAAPRPGGRRPQRLRHVLDQLVYGGSGSGGVPQRGTGSRLGVGVRRTPVRLHRRLRDHAAGRTGARRTVSFQTKCAHRLYRLQRRRGETTGSRTRQAVSR